MPGIHLTAACKLSVKLMFNFQEKTVLITGAGRGIGAEIARMYKESGAQVIGTGSSDRSLQAMEAAEIEAHCIDIRDREAMTDLFNKIREKYGRLDILVNNAGVAADTPAAAFKPDLVDRIIDTNFKGLFYACQAYQKTHKKEGGIIINIASILGMISMPLTSVYSGTKGAVIQLTKALALEWARYNFRVNAICPGLIETDMTDSITKREQMKESVVNSIPLKRMGRPEDIAPWALFLASEMAGYATGQTYVVDGGLTAQ